MSAERAARERRVRPLILRLAFLKDMGTWERRFWLEQVLELRREAIEWRSAADASPGHTVGVASSAFAWAAEMVRMQKWFESCGEILWFYKGIGFLFFFYFKLRLFLFGNLVIWNLRINGNIFNVDLFCFFFGSKIF